MSLSRRRFVKAASLAVLAGAARPVAFAQTVPRRLDDTFQDKNLSVLDNASEETFRPLVGERFTVMRGNLQLQALTLESVTSAEQPTLPSKASRTIYSPNQARETIHSFGLHFQGSGKALPQGTYTMNNRSLGNFALFIVPGAPRMNPNTYTATFTLLTA